MAYFPQEIKTKTELQEKTTQLTLSNTHVTTMNFGEFNIAFYRHNTPRETYNADVSVFARPFPMQTPVLAKADHKLKFYYVPFRTITPQWNAFINKSPYVPANGTVPIQVQEMPYFTTATLYTYFTDNNISTITTDPNEKEDFTDEAGNKRILTPFGRYSLKILQQLGYDLIADSKGTEHIDAMGLLAAAKVYLDFYYNSSYLNITAEAIDIEQYFKKDANTAFELQATDLAQIFTFIQKVFYEESYVTAAWDNPSAPNNDLFNGIGTVELKDITIEGNANGGYKSFVTNQGTTAINTNGTPTIQGLGQTGSPVNNGAPYTISQYVIDSLKKMTDYCVRFAMAGVREVDRYLARFGVLLAAEKMKRSIYYGEQITPMEFGAVYSTASTERANIGEYAGQGIINSDNKEHKHVEIQSDEYGIILGIATIIPKANYFQGIDRNNLHHEVETYFSGVFDQLGSAAVSSAEILASTDLRDTNHNKDNVLKTVYGYLPRGYEYKIARDRLTGDFRRGKLLESMASWHFYRILQPSWFPNGLKHNPAITKMFDSEQYLRIFDNTSEEDGDHFYCIYQIAAEGMAHTKPLYDTYDFESEGKEIMLNGNGPKQN